MSKHATTPSQPPITLILPPKPIFMIGLPNSTTPQLYDVMASGLETRLSDYHVIVLRNTTNIYTAKLFSEKGDDTMDIKDIKKYIDQKMK